MRYKGFTLTDRNYDAAIKLLQIRFGRKDIVISADMPKLLNLTPVKRSSDRKALSSVPCDTYGSLLCPVLLQLIPEDTDVAYTRKLDSDGKWKVPEPIQFL